MSGSSGSSAASGGESSLESEAPFQRTSRPRSSAGIERQTTSDYASRSPSFKYETSSLVQVPIRSIFFSQKKIPEKSMSDIPIEILQTSQIWQLPPWDDSGLDPSAESQPEVTETVPEAKPPRKVILRSKSDVGQSRFAPDLLPAIPAEFTGDVPADLDRFFDTIGMVSDASSILAPETLGASGRSCTPPVFFSSVSSVDSCCKKRHVDNACESSDSDDRAATLQRRLLGDPFFKISNSITVTIIKVSITNSKFIVIDIKICIALVVYS